GRAPPAARHAVPRRAADRPDLLGAGPARPIGSAPGSLGGVGDRAEKSEFGLPRVEPRVLHDDRHVRDDDRAVVAVPRHRLRVFKIVEAHMQRAPRRHGHAVGADRLLIGEIDHDRHRSVLIPGIEQARRLVADEGAAAAGALPGDIAFCDGPASLANGRCHALLLMSLIASSPEHHSDFGTGDSACASRSRSRHSWSLPWRAALRAAASSAARRERSGPARLSLPTKPPASGCVAGALLPASLPGGWTASGPEASGAPTTPPDCARRAVALSAGAVPPLASGGTGWAAPDGCSLRPYRCASCAIALSQLC